MGYKLLEQINRLFPLPVHPFNLQNDGVTTYAKWQYELALLKNENDLSSYTQYFGEYQDLDLYKNVEGNDWQDTMYGRTGNPFNHNINITGGTDQIK